MNVFENMITLSKQINLIVTIDLFRICKNLPPSLSRLLSLSLCISSWAYACLINNWNDRADWRGLVWVNDYVSIWRLRKGEKKNIYWFFHLVTQIKSYQISQTIARHRCWITNDMRLDFKWMEWQTVKINAAAAATTAAQASLCDVFMLAPWFRYSFFCCCYCLACFGLPRWFVSSSVFRNKHSIAHTTPYITEWN